jgi:DNA-binding beta-propeller fold protein YncE
MTVTFTATTVSLCETPNPSGGLTGGNFQNPSGVGVDAHGDIFVSEWSGNVITEFQPNWGFIRQFGNNLNGPAGIVMDNVNGLLYVLDINNGQVQSYTQQGVYVTRLWSDNTEPTPWDGFGW